MTLNRIIWHHTGGPYAPTPLDLAAYHLVIDGDGQIHRGRHPIEANAAGRELTPGTYAAHTKGLNTGAIGLSLACMGGALWAKPETWRLPKPAQIDALVAESAKLCVAHVIVPDRRTTLSHAEVEITLGVKQAGKWDFDYWPRGGAGARDPIAIGDELRADLRRAIAALGQGSLVRREPVKPVLRRGSQGAAVRELQRLLARRAPLAIDGAFGPATHAAVVAFQRVNQLLPDGIVGQLTWAALARI